MNRLTKQIDYDEAVKHIYGLAHNVSLNKSEQYALISALDDIETHSIKVGESNHRIVQLMLSLIYDGLAFGNWPWTK